MSSGSALLNAIIEQAANSPNQDLGAGLLRFELEYRVQPDLEVERQKIGARLHGGAFDLFPVHSEIANILILQFSDAKRTISRRGQFAIAAELVDSLGLRSCTPEGASNFAVDDVEGTDAEGAAADAILDLTCWTTPDPQMARDWVADSLNVRGAWKTTRGAGIKIAQPDTGVAQHEAIANALAMHLALDVFTGKRGQATDPLDPEMGNPGHGTATSSVIVGQHAESLFGIAPEAECVPIRCINSVIFALDGSLIARAILHARAINADVISMSLGGPFLSKSIAQALKLAVDSGIIVVAAAGNCCKVVVYPASDQNTIAVAGVGQDGRPWRGTSTGADVDVAAASENVFVARRTAVDNGRETIDPSQGTSFGTALTAGVAALWLSHHGRNAVRAEASKRGIAVNELFRAAVRQTSSKPAVGWSPGLGAGIVNAGELLALELDNIVAPAERAEASLSSGLDRHARIAELSRRGEVVDGFDWARHGAEAVFLSTECIARTEAGLSFISESPAAPEASTALSQAVMPDDLRHTLAQLVVAPPVSMPTPWLARGAGGSVFGDLPQGGLEDLESVRQRRATIETKVRGANGSAGLEALQSRSEKLFAALESEKHDPDQKRARAEILESGLEAYRRIQKGEDLLRLPLEMRFGMESLVRLTDRPALRIINDNITREDPFFLDGAWGPRLIHQEFLPPTVKATGRINLDTRHIGTGVLIAKGGEQFVMTNRHVLEAFGEEVTTSKGTKWVFPYGRPRIDFSDSGKGIGYELTEVVFTGPDATHGRVNFKVLDLVLLRIAAAAGLPSPLKVVAATSTIDKETELFVLGYPAAPGPSAFVDPVTGKYNDEISKRLALLFGVDYGRKYLSPGVLTVAPGGMGRRDPKGWVMVHDATTLGGNSGSLVVALQGRGEVVGLHFAGAPLSGNFAHDLTRIDRLHT